MKRIEDIIYHVLDEYTGEEVTYEKVTSYFDGTSMLDSKVDGVVYKKLLTGEYFKRNLPNNIVTPEIFGAIGDGVTDDTVALQKAFNSGFKVLLLKNKTYKYNTTLTLKDNIIVEGENNTSVLFPDIDNFTFRNNWNPATIVNLNSKIASNSDDFSNPNSNISLSNFKILMKSDVVTNMNSILRFSGMIGLNINDCIFEVSSNTLKGHNAIIDLHASYKNVIIKNNLFIISTNSPNYGGAIWVQNEGTVDCENVEICNNQFTVASKDETLAIYTINGSGKVKNVKAYNNILTKPDYTTSPSSMLTVFGNTENIDVYNNWLFSNQVSGTIDGILRVGTSVDSTNTNKPNNIKINNNKLIGVFTTSYGFIGYSGNKVEILNNIILATDVNGTTNFGIVSPNSNLSQNWNISGNSVTNFATGIVGGSIIEKNIISNSFTGVRGYRKIVDNIIDAKTRGLHLLALGSSENYEVARNQITVLSTATEAIGLDTGAFGFAKTYIGHNLLKSIGGTSKGITQIAGAGSIGTIQEDNNTFTVTGVAIDVTATKTLTNIDNLSGLNNLTTARTNLGLGTLATQNSSSVNITGGVLSGLTSLGVSGLTVGVYGKAAINASSNMFANVTPVVLISPAAVPTIPSETLVSFKNSFSSATAGLRRMGVIFKLSDESTVTESNKSGGIIVESTQGFSNSPEVSLVLENQKVFTVVSGGVASHTGGIKYKTLVSAASTLVLLNTSTILTFNGTTTTWTLPTLTGNDGLAFTIINMGSGAITLNSNIGGADIFNGANVSTITILAGTTVNIYHNSLKYVVKI